MFAHISVTLAKKDSAQIIPVAAILTRNQGPAVFVVGDSSKAVLTPVTLGIIDGESAEIVSPRITGPIVAIGQHFLTDGALVSTGKPGGSGGAPVAEGKKPGKGAK